jgi:hypothetical protein
MGRVHGGGGGAAPDAYDKRVRYDVAPA